jgi:uncharacterized protein
MVNHACNLRCTYCYTGAKFHSAMPATIATTAMDRAFNTLAPGGRLDVGFFGGEPLLEATRILDWMRYAREKAAMSGHNVDFSLTTNGTLDGDEAWRVMTAPDLELTVSFDGNPAIHDRHRKDANGHPTSAKVVALLERLLRAGREFQVNVVVRPDTLAQLPEGLLFLRELGVRQVLLSLDLWTHWSSQDGRSLERAIHQAARLWRSWLPGFSINWFDLKAGALAQLPVVERPTQCGFGHGEIAVAPGGHLYPAND